MNEAMERSAVDNNDTTNAQSKRQFENGNPEIGCC
jgi:hypothetical protein